MADSDKDILITPNVSQTSQPEIKFVGKDNSPMYLKVLDDNTLSFEGTEGQVFSISPTMSSGDIFSVTDISGVQSIAVNANGTVALAPVSGNVGIGTTSPSQLLHLQSATANVLIESTATSGEAPVLDLYKNDSGPAVSEAIGTIKFSGENDQDQKVTYAEIQAYIEDETDATENAAFQFWVQEMGTPRENLRLASNQITFNNSERDVNVLIKSDDGSTNFFSDAGTNRVGIGTTSPGHLLEVAGGGSNGEIVTNRTSGAEIKLQAQASTGVFGTTSNHALALMTNGSQRVKINNVGGIEAVSNANGWNLWHKLTFGALDYGTATGQGNGLKLLTFDDNEAGLPKYALPRDITIRAVAFHTNGVVLSGNTAQVFRIFANGDAGAGTLTNISYNASQFTRQNSENSNATDHYLVVTGVDASYSAGDTLACRRESGAVDMGDYVVHIWYSIDNA